MASVRIERVGQTIRVTILTEGGQKVEYGLTDANVIANETIGDVQVFSAHGTQALYSQKVVKKEI